MGCEPRVICTSAGDTGRFAVDWTAGSSAVVCRRGRVKTGML